MRMYILRYMRIFSLITLFSPSIFVEILIVWRSQYTLYDGRVTMCTATVIHACDGRRTRCMAIVVHIKRRPPHLVVTAYQHKRYAIIFLLFCNYRIQKRQAAFDENFLLALI